MPDDTQDLPDLLARLDDIWQQAGGDWLHHLNPGLTPEAIDATTADLPIRLPHAARIWFQWHDGTTAEQGALTGDRIGGSVMRFLSLAAAVRYYRLVVKLALEAADMDEITPAEAGWDSTWFPLMTDLGGGDVGIDCATPPDRPAPLRRVDKADMNPEHIDAPSLTSVVRLWVDLHEWGAMRFDPDTGVWGLADWNAMISSRVINGHPLPDWLPSLSTFV